MKILKKHGILIIIIAIVILLVIGLILYLNGKPIKNDLLNSYDYDDKVVELPNTSTYKNDKLSSKHCLNDICIDNATFYYNDNEGRVEYTITNNSNSIKSGYLKMIFKDQNLKIIYKNLEPKKTIKSRSSYMGIDIKDKSDYKLEELTKEEISKIVK